MDRLQFMNELDMKDQDFASMVISSFDQFMALYSLVGHYENLHVQNEGNLCFTVSLDDNEKIIQLQNAINYNGYIIQIYNRLFNISVLNVDDKSMTISIF